MGLARYLDPAKDLEKYAPMPTLGWDRAYRSGDLVRFESEGLVFQGRADDQVKVGGRRIELGEVENALQDLEGVSAAAAAVRTTEAGVPVLVGYLVLDGELDRAAARAELAEVLPAAIVPLLAVVDELPVRTSGKVDRAALPWPLPGVEVPAAGLSPAEAWLAEQWQAVLGLAVPDRKTDFFDLGGGSLAAAQLVSRIRARVPDFSVADIYDVPRLGAMAKALGPLLAEDDDASFRRPEPTPRATQWVQTALSAPLFILSGIRWLLYLLTAGTILNLFPSFSALPARALVGAGRRPPRLRHPVRTDGGGRGIRSASCSPVCGPVTIPAAERCICGSGSPSRSPSRSMRWVSPVRRGCRTTPVRSGRRSAGTSTCTRSRPSPGCSRSVTVPRSSPKSTSPATGSTATRCGSVRSAWEPMRRWAPAARWRRARASASAPRSLPAPRSSDACAPIRRGPDPRPSGWARQPRTGRPSVRRAATAGCGRTPRRRWCSRCSRSSSFAAGAFVIALGMRGSASLGAALGAAFVWLVPATLVVGLVFAGAVVILVRLLSLGLREGTFPVRSRSGWQAWTIERLLDSARTILFPLYSSLFTPVWLRMLGAEVGKDVEASTVLLIPSMTRIEDGAFLADDTMVASYELTGGWMRVGAVRIGKRAFLGNSGMAAAGHRVPRDGLVAVLSSAPVKAKPGSSWLGSPAVRLRRQSAEGDESRTYDPPTRLRVARALWELCRLVPVFVTCGIGVLVLFALAWLLGIVGPVGTLLLSGFVMLAAGALAAGLSVAAKWIIVGPIRAGGAAAVVELRVAHRGLRHLHRDGRRSLVRPERRRHPRAGGLAARSRREDRAGCLVRQLLAARARPRHAGRWIHGQPRVRRADPPVP